MALIQIVSCFLFRTSINHMQCNTNQNKTINKNKTHSIFEDYNLFLIHYVYSYEL